MSRLRSKLSRPRWLLVAALPGAAIAALVAGGGGAGAFNPQPDPPGGLGLVGIVQDQTLRLNAVNVALGGPDTSQRRCRVALGFADMQGRAIGDAENFELRPGAGAFVDLEAAAIGNPDIREGGRAEVRPVGRAIGAPNEKSCVPVYSAEVFGPQGTKTEVYVGDPSDG